MTRVTHSHTASVVTLQQASGFVWNDPISIFVQQLAYTFFQQLAYTYMYNARPSTCTECVACTTRPGLAALGSLHYQARTGSTGRPALPGQDWQHWVACTTRPGLAALGSLHYQARTGSTGRPALPGQDWQHWVACTTRPGLAALDGLHYQARTGSTGWPALPGQDWQHWVACTTRPGLATLGRGRVQVGYYRSNSSHPDLEWGTHTT